MKKRSYFDGGLIEYILLHLLWGFITTVTFGLAYPWYITRVYGWRINHTVIEGRRLKFTGQGINLLGRWIWWGFLTLITFGIYGFWLGIKIEQWKVSHTEFK